MPKKSVTFGQKSLTSEQKVNFFRRECQLLANKVSTSCKQNLNFL